MKTVILGCSVLALAILVLPEIAAQAGKAGGDQAETTLPVELILSPDHLTVTPNSDLVLSVRWINHSDESLSCGSFDYSTGISEEYSYDIRTSDGKPVPRIPGKEKEKATLYPITGPEILCKLAPGASIDQLLRGLMGVFEMNKPEEYAVRVSLPDPGHPGQILGRSNVVTVTVQPPQ